ncbi:MAG: type II secretion system protein [Acidobacteria bacterium]|nr:type II secretion system protein [Acidobacteriota bacterium]
MSSSRGFTLIELLIVVMLIGVLAALTAPFLLAAKAAANQASAVGSLRALNAAQSSFSSTCGNGFYTLSLTTLVTERFGSADLDLTPKSGYRFALGPSSGSLASPADCTAQPTQTGYYFAAEPLTVETGTLGLAINQGGMLWENSAGTAPPEPFAAGGTIGPYGGG